MKSKSPQSQLAAFIAKYTPEIGALARAALAKMRARLPGAVQLVYDNYNALVIGFGPSERASEAVCSIALYPKWVTLFFLRGVDLPDPHKRLKGSGKLVRQIVLDSALTLDEPEVMALMAHALQQSPKPIGRKNPGRIVIKSISLKQRPRRPSAPVNAGSDRQGREVRSTRR